MKPAIASQVLGCDVDVQLGAYLAATAACTAPGVFTHAYIGSVAGDLASLLSGGQAGFAAYRGTYLELGAPVLGLVVVGQWFLRLFSRFGQQ